MGVFFDGDEMMGSGAKSSVSYQRSAQPSLWRDWATYPTLNPSFGPTAGPAVAFTRGSTATFVGSNGLIQTAAANTPRFDYDPVTLACKGLLIEEQRTNLLLQSKVLATSPWIRAGGTQSFTNDAATSPEGTVTALSWGRTVTTVSYVAQTVLASASTPYTFSIYMKSNTARYGALRFQGQSNSLSATFDLSSGSVSLGPVNNGGYSNFSAAIQNVGSGWYRCSLTATTAPATTSLECIYSFNSNNVPIDGTDSSATSSGFLWGAQLEVGSFATSYIPTTTATVTRAADVAQITGSDFTSFYNQSAGTYFANQIFAAPTNYGINQHILEFSDGTVSNRISAFRDFSSGFINSRNVLNNTQTNAGSSNPLSTGSIVKFAHAATTGSTRAAVNGNLTTANTPSGMPLVTMLTIGATYQTGAGTSFLNGWLASIAYYRTRLTDAQLQSLTA